MAAECKIKNELGTISVVEDVITTVAGYAAVECIGIVAMASKRATDGLVELLGRENLKRGVRVALSEDSCAISLYIIVEYGVSIAAVAKNVIESSSTALRAWSASRWTRWMSRLRESASTENKDELRAAEPAARSFKFFQPAGLHVWR